MNPHFQRGLELREQRRLKQAIGEFQAALEVEPDNGAIWFQLGMSHDNRGEEEEAIPCYVNAIGLGIEQSDLLRAHLYLASSYLKTGYPGLAQVTLTAAVQNGCSEEQARRMQRRIDRALTRLSLTRQQMEEGHSPA